MAVQRSAKGALTLFVSLAITLYLPVHHQINSLAAQGLLFIPKEEREKERIGWRELPELTRADPDRKPTVEGRSTANPIVKHCSGAEGGKTRLRYPPWHSRRKEAERARGDSPARFVPGFVPSSRPGGGDTHVPVIPAPSSTGNPSQNFFLYFLSVPVCVRQESVRGVVARKGIFW